MNFLLGVLVSLALVEVGLRVPAVAWWKSSMQGVLTPLQAFAAAQDDRDRQASLQRAGWMSLRLGVGLGGALVAAAALTLTPPWTLAWSPRETTGYFTAMSVAAMVWWAVRARMRGQPTRHRTDARQPVPPH